MEDYTFTFLIAKAIHVISILILVVASIILGVRLKKAGAFIMIVGSFLMLILSVADTPIIAYAASQGSENVVKVQGIISIVSGFFYFLFGLGVLVLAFDLIKRQKDTIE